MNEKEIVHVASRIQSALRILHKHRYRRCIAQLDLLVSKVGELGPNARKLKAALARNWKAAAEHTCKNASRLLSDIPFMVTNVQSLLNRRCVEVPKLSMIVEELRALHDEFDDVEWDRENYALCSGSCSWLPIAA